MGIHFMIGMDRNTGKALSGVEHIKQSIIVILTTPIGSRVMRRDFGSDLLNLVDLPMNEQGKSIMIAAIADSLSRFEKRIKIRQISILGNNVTSIVLSFEAIFTDGGQSLQLTNIEVSR